MWFKNLKIYRLQSGALPSIEQLEQALEKRQFQPGAANEMQSIGWISPREDSGMVYALDGQLLITMRTEAKLLPATVVNQFMQAKAREIEEQQGFKPGRKQLKEIKEQVTDDLLPKAFSQYRDTHVWLDTRNGWLVIDATSDAKCDEVLGLLAKSVDPFPVSPLYVEQSPAGAMTSWLLDDEAPANFTIDQDTDLQSTSDSGAKVRYVRQSVDVADVQKHVQSGKQVTRLALTWADRVSLVLTEGLEVRRITPLDILKEGSDLTQSDAEQFDSYFTLMTGELSRLLADLVDALGGERQPI
ncbi:recombination-associated protein RdgC [Pusillimonas sp. ANT_WB101]|uniref:recombination-associated protein RdgC n=1 Tax=Pusillimonas sp. ANT_WB101 TaxID=2597356 RepID=UPI0011EF6703|nr:recombination-associated protein RdgC [Pusillimonas sp. ANT_WB101]KAA0910643.1 recombination-associated protein RdgC [Pusillimonas sp. ANT_WB101]